MPPSHLNKKMRSAFVTKTKHMGSAVPLCLPKTYGKPQAGHFVRGNGRRPPDFRMAPGRAARPRASALSPAGRLSCAQEEDIPHHCRQFVSQYTSKPFVCKGVKAFGMVQSVQYAAVETPGCKNFETEGDKRSLFLSEGNACGTMPALRNPGISQVVARESRFKKGSRREGMID